MRNETEAFGERCIAPKKKSPLHLPPYVERTPESSVWSASATDKTCHGFHLHSDSINLPNSMENTSGSSGDKQTLNSCTASVTDDNLKPSEAATSSLQKLAPDQKKENNPSSPASSEHVAAHTKASLDSKSEKDIGLLLLSPRLPDSEINPKFSQRHWSFSIFSTKFS